MPANPHTDRPDGVARVDAEAARETAGAARAAGLLADVPSGATPAASARKPPALSVGCRVRDFNHDTGKRHLSSHGFLPARARRAAQAALATAETLP